MMKGAAIFLLIAISCIVALPVEPDVTSEVDNVHALVPDGPVMEETHTADQETVARQRRSPRPDDAKGSVGVSVEEESKQGTKIKVDADRVLWKSDDGKSRIDVTGEWSKIVDGPRKGKPDVSGFINFKHDI